MCGHVVELEDPRQLDLLKCLNIVWNAFHPKVHVFNFYVVVDNGGLDCGLVHCGGFAHS